MAPTDDFNLVLGTVDNPLPSSPFERGTIEDWKYRTVQKYRDTIDNETPEEGAFRRACQEELKRKRAASELYKIGLQTCDGNSHASFPDVSRPFGQHRMRTKPPQHENNDCGIISQTTSTNTADVIEPANQAASIGEPQTPSFGIGSPPAPGLPEPRIPNSGPYGLHPRTPRGTHSGRQPHSFTGIKERLLETQDPDSRQDCDSISTQKTSGYATSKSSPTLGRHGEDLTIGEAMPPWGPGRAQPVRPPETPTFQVKHKPQIPRSRDDASPPSSPPEFNGTIGAFKLPSSPELPVKPDELSKQPFSSPLRTTATRHAFDASISPSGRIWSGKGRDLMSCPTTESESTKPTSRNHISYDRGTFNAKNNDGSLQTDLKQNLRHERTSQESPAHPRKHLASPTVMTGPVLRSTSAFASPSSPVRTTETTLDAEMRGLSAIPSYQSIGQKTRAAQGAVTDQNLHPAPLRINSKGYAVGDSRVALNPLAASAPSFTIDSRSMSAPSTIHSKPMSKKLSSSRLPMSVTRSIVQDKSALIGSHTIGNLHSPREKTTTPSTGQSAWDGTASHNATMRGTKTTVSGSSIPQPTSPLLQPRRQPSFSVISKLSSPARSESPRELLHQELQFSGGTIRAYHRKVPHTTISSLRASSGGAGGQFSRTITPGENPTPALDRLKEQFNASQRPAEPQSRRTSNLDKIPTSQEIGDYFQDMLIDWMYQRRKLEPAEFTLSKRSKPYERNQTPTFNEAVDQIVELLRAQSSPGASSSLPFPHQPADANLGSAESSSLDSQMVSSSSTIWDMSGLIEEVLDPFEVIETQNMDIDMQEAYDMVRVALHNTFDNRRDHCTPLEAVGEVLKIMSDACDAPLGDLSLMPLEAPTDHGQELTEVPPRHRLPKGALGLYWATAFYNREERTQNIAVNKYREDFLMSHGDQYKHLEPAEVGKMLQRHGLETWRQHMADLWESRQQVIQDMLQIKMDEVDRRIRAGKRWVEAIAEVAKLDENQVLQNERFAAYAKKH